jgi:hypothetical protein
MPVTTTLKRIRSSLFWTDGWKKLLHSLDKTKPDDDAYAAVNAAGFNLTAYAAANNDVADAAAAAAYDVADAAAAAAAAAADAAYDTARKKQEEIFRRIFG